MVASVDAQNSFRFVAAHLVMSRAIDMAKEFSIGLVSMKHSNYYGIAT